MVQSCLTISPDNNSQKLAPSWWLELMVIAPLLLLMQSSGCYLTYLLSYITCVFILLGFIFCVYPFVHLFMPSSCLWHSHIAILNDNRQVMFLVDNDLPDCCALFKFVFIFNSCACKLYSDDNWIDCIAVCLSACISELYSDGLPYKW